MSETIDSNSPPSEDAGLFGCDLDLEHDRIIIVGVPWEPTASYGRGTSMTPNALVRASHQLDFFDLDRGTNIGEQVGMLPLNSEWLDLNRRCTALADPIIVSGGAVSPKLQGDLEEVNQSGARLNQQLGEKVAELMDLGKIVGVLGGDHSAPLGAMATCLNTHPRAGVLHIDAHHDLRVAYEGFTYSHASVLYNLLHICPHLNTLVSVGIRDFCKEEYEFAQRHHAITTFYNRDLKKQLHGGRSWQDLSEEIIDCLPEEVYITFDIDGLDPAFCPHTGTPVPGGPDFDQIVHMLELIVQTKRRVVGFDLCEVAPSTDNPMDEWDLNVGARILHKLCSITLAQAQ